MVLGIGTDLVDERRIASAIERFQTQFVNRVYTQREQKEVAHRRALVKALSNRFAAKEACAKALGTGFRQGISWHHIEILTGEWGRPSLVLTGAAEVRLKDMLPEGYKPILHLSMTDEQPYCQAFVVISAEKSE